MYKRLFKIVSGQLKNIVNSQYFLRIMEVFDRRSENRITEFGMLAQAFEFKAINNVKGDYFEFGLWRGKTFCYAHLMKLRYRQFDTKLFGFDSFQGLPEIKDPKDNIWSQGQFACSENELRQHLKVKGFLDNEFELIPGYYENSLNDSLHKQFQNNSAAIVYIDCDLYESTIQVLNFISRYLVNGSIVCFDDYYNYKGSPDQGEQKAMSDFLQEHQKIQFIPYFDYSPLGKSFIVRLQE